MKNFTNKQIVKIICIFVALLCIGFLLGTFVGISRKNREYKESNSSQLENQKENVFYASIETIREYNGITSLVVKGLDVNDINYRGKFSFSIDGDTELLWRYTEIDISSLKVGQNISITHTGEVLTIYPAQLTKVTRIMILDDEVEENINNKVTTIDIESIFGVEGIENKSVTLNQEEIYEIFSIIDNLEFSKETCDGLPSFYIKYNSEEKDAFITYGIEIYDNQYHIISEKKGEAILSQDKIDKLDKIITKYFGFLTTDEKQESTTSNITNVETEKKENINETEYISEYLKKYEKDFNTFAINGFIISTNTYTKPNEIDLEQVFYNGAGFNNKVSLEEIEEYKKVKEYHETDIVKVTTQQAEKLYFDNTGERLENLKERLKSWTYIEKYDAYYHEVSDTNFERVSCIKGIMNEQNKVIEIQLSNNRTISIKIDYEKGTHYIISNNNTN